MNSTFAIVVFSAEVHLGMAIDGDAGIPVLEDITDEEAEVTSASEGKQATSRQSKLKVPRK